MPSTNNKISTSGSNLYNASTINANSYGIVSTGIVSNGIVGAYPVRNSLSYGMSNGIAKLKNSNIIETVLRAIPIILDNLNDNEITDRMVICEIYNILITSCTYLDSTEEKIERYKIIYEMSKGNKATWILYNKHKDDDVALIASTLLMHCY